MSNTYVTAIIDDRLDAYLQRMADSGLYGEDRSDVIVFALQTAVQAAVAAGIIKLTPPPVEEVEEVSTAPAPAGSPTSGYTVRAAAAGDFVVIQGPPTGPNCAHVRTDCPCDKPGCLGDEIPF